jgi:hypothetical protein
MQVLLVSSVEKNPIPPGGPEGSMTKYIRFQDFHATMIARITGK